MTTTSISFLENTLKENLILAVTPLKPLSYYQRYIYLLEEITSHGNALLRWTVYFNLTIIFYLAGHFLYLYANKNLNNFEHVLNYDVFYHISSGKSSVQLMAFSVTLNLAYSVYLLHFKTNLKINRILYDIMFEDNLSLFTSSTWKGVNISKRIRVVFLFTLNFFQMFIVNASKLKEFFHKQRNIFLFFSCLQQLCSLSTFKRFVFWKWAESRSIINCSQFGNVLFERLCFYLLFLLLCQRLHSNHYHGNYFSLHFSHKSRANFSLSSSPP